MNLEEIENNNRVAKSRRKMAGFSDKRWMEEIDWLIAEVKRLQSVCQEEHERFLLALSDCQNKDFEIDKLQAENERFREYVVKTGCSYTQTEDGIECDYEYPWPCDHCPVLEHNKAIDTEMKVGNDNHN